MRRLRFPVLAALLCSIGGDRAHAQAPRSIELPYQTIPLATLSGFRAPSANWTIAGGATADRSHPLALTADPGTGVLVNQPTTSVHGPLVTSWEHGDIDLSLDVMLSKSSSSGVYLMGRYEVQLSDSWGVASPTFDDMGAIGRRWDPKRGVGSEGYEGVAPRLNASRAPGLWQHLQISFRAPRFEGKRKVANAHFVKVMLNGVVVQENVEVTGPTRAAAFDDERATGPLVIEGDHGPIAVRDIEYKAYSGAVALSGLHYRAWTNDAIDAGWMTSHPPTREGIATSLSSEPAGAPNRFAVAFDGTLSVPTTGRYRFTLNIDWIGSEASMQGDKVAGAWLTIDGKQVLSNNGAAQRVVSDVDLTAGKHPFALSFFKNRQWGNNRDVQLWIEGPGVQRQPLHDESLLLSFGNPMNPIVVAPAAEPVLVRSFEWHRGIKRVTVISVADPMGVHYSYDLAQGAPMYAWRGPFLETTQMWDGRGEDQSARPMGSTLEMPGTPTLAFLSDANAAWPDSITDEREFKRGGFRLDKAGRPTFLATVRGIAVEDALRPDANGVALTRELRLHAPTGVSTEGVYVQLAQSAHVTPQRDGSFAIDDKSYFITLPAGSAQPVVRQRNGRDELLVPVHFDRGEARVAYSIVW